MKKLLTVLLTVCIAITITACANSVAPDVDDAANTSVPSIDRLEVDAIIIQYENSGQYYLSSQEIAEFADLYNNPESFTISDEDLKVEEAYDIVVTHKNGDYLLIDKYDDAEYDFTAVEYIDLDSLHNPDSTYLMKNTSLASFTDKIVQEKFLAN